MKYFILLITFVTLVFSIPLQTNFKTTRSIEEEEAFVNALEHYENIVDVVLSSESEDLLINLSHVPRAVIDRKLQIQAYALDIYPLNHVQRVKMPVIIGKHVHEMNFRIYQSIETTITMNWAKVYDQGQLSFTSLNGIMAQELINQIDDYNLLTRIKEDTKRFSSFDHKTLLMRLFTKEDELDMLSQFIVDIKTSLLLELHIQLMDFLTRMQFEMMEYNENS